MNLTPQQMKRQELQRLLFRSSDLFYGKDNHMIKIPFHGGWIELVMSFNNGMIDLVSATAVVMGLSSSCDEFSIGYTCPVGLAKSTAIALEKLSDAGLSYEANLYNW